MTDPPARTSDEIINSYITYDQHPVPSPPDAVGELRRALVHLDEQRQALVEAGDVDGLSWGAADLDLVIGDLRAVQHSARTNIAALLDAEWDDMGKRGRPRREIPGLGVVEVWGGSERRNWESDELLRLLILRAIVDENGEVRDETAMELAGRIYNVLASCLPITASLNWRVGQRGKGNGLRGVGIDPSEYCQEVDAPRLAKIPKQKRENDA